MRVDGIVRSLKQPMAVGTLDLGKTAEGTTIHSDERKTRKLYSFLLRIVLWE